MFSFLPQLLTGGTILDRLRLIRAQVLSVPSNLSLTGFSIYSQWSQSMILAGAAKS